MQSDRNYTENQSYNTVSLLLLLMQRDRTQVYSYLQLDVLHLLKSEFVYFLMLFLQQYNIPRYVKCEQADFILRMPRSLCLHLIGFKFRRLLRKLKL
jgi:hypothetical protein